MKRSGLAWVGALGLLWSSGTGCKPGSAPGAGLGGLGVGREQIAARAREVVRAAAESEAPEQRCHALESLAAQGGSEAGEQIRGRLVDRVAAVRFAAAAAAGDVQDPAVRSAGGVLERLLRDEDPSVRLAAGYALEKLGDRRFGGWYDAALGGSDLRLAGQACWLLGKLGETEWRRDSRAKLWQALRRSGATGGGAAVKLQAAEALARLGDREVLPKLLAYAGSGYADDRLMAVSGLESLGGEEATAMLVVLVEDVQIEVRLAAIGALGWRATADQVAAARAALAYQDEQGDAAAMERVRGLAALALGRAGGQADGVALYRAMADKSAYVRVAAARAALDWLRRWTRR